MSANPEDVRIDAIRAWYRLDRAFDSARVHLQRRFGITGEQLALLRIIGEKDQWGLTALRESLSMHPATLGQSLGRMEQRGLLTIEVDPEDRRRRIVAITEGGRQLCREAPLIGPVRLRTGELSVEQAALLTSAFEAAVALFGLEPFAARPRGDQRKLRTEERS